MPSVLRLDGSTSMATVELDTVSAPNGPPCSVLTIVNNNKVEAAKYPAKKMANAPKLIISTVFLGKASTTYPLKGRNNKAVMV